MKSIFFTQASSLDLFYNLMQALREVMPMDKVGFYVANSRFFKQFEQKHPEIGSNSFYLLKEWEIIRDSKAIRPDISLLERYEKEIGQPYLWNALVWDRRIYYGKKYAYAQDYSPRFSHERMLAILQTGLVRMENFFNNVKPDFIVSFISVTLGEYLAYLFACARNIPVLNLRPTRIRNYFYAGESILEPSERLKETYEKFLKDGIETSLKNEASSYLQEVRNTHAMYEGVVAASNKPPANTNWEKKRLKLSKLTKLIDLLVGEYKYRFGEYHDDNHISGYIGPFVSLRIIRPWRTRVMDKLFRNLYIKPKDLPLINYAFFPLHSEPEVTLSVYSKPYLNQIEAVRLFSHNLPVGMKLIVKEHPWAIGKRPLSYYRKLLDIPNVLLARPELKSRELIFNARIITVIAGSIGLEALILKKPVVVMGRTPFNFLPSCMIRHANNPDSLSDEIRDLLENYEYNGAALLGYISAVIKESVPVDFYSRFLQRRGVFGAMNAEDEILRMEHISRLANYIFNITQITR